MVRAKYRKVEIRIVFMWLLGFSATSPLLSLPLGGHLISLYTIVLAIVFVILVHETRGTMGYYKKTPLDVRFNRWCALGLISSVFGFFFFWGDDTWMSASVSFVPKIILYFLLFYLIGRSRNNHEYCRAICYGIIWGLIINICWSVADAFIFYISGVSITNELFAYYIAISDIRFGVISLTIGGTIRSCGLNIDPANIGLFAPIVALYGLYSKRYVIYGLSILSIFASLSHTAFVSVVLVTFFYFFFVSKKRLVSLIGLILIGSAIIVLLSVVEIGALTQMQEAFIERTEEKADGSELEGERGRYWVTFIPAAIRQPTAFFIGTGYFTASYPYIKNKYVHLDLIPYDPEQTYFSMYFDIGLIGLIIYLSLLIGIYKSSKRLIRRNGDKQSLIINSGIVGSSVAALGYHYTLYSVIMLIIICGIVQNNTYARYCANL